MNDKNVRLIINYVGLALLLSIFVLAGDSFYRGDSLQGVKEISIALMASLGTALSPINRKSDEETQGTQVANKGETEEAPTQ